MADVVSNVQHLSSPERPNLVRCALTFPYISSTDIIVRSVMVARSWVWTRPQMDATESPWDIAAPTPRNSRSVPAADGLAALVSSAYVTKSGSQQYRSHLFLTERGQEKMLR
jgi:hypothetical protein